MSYKRVINYQFGGPDEMHLVDQAIPEPKAGQVRIKILNSGVSYADLLIREGVHPETPRPPFTLGWDLAGVVDKAGKKVTRLEPGQMVAALPVVGGYAQYICLPEVDCVPVPDGLEPVVAVSLVFNYITAYQMMHRTAAVKHGERVLIHGAAGGIGTALLQLGRLMDLEMYGTASKKKHEIVRELDGVPIDYRHKDFVEEIPRLAGGGVDVVFDGIGGRHLGRSYKTLRRGGRVITYGLTSSLKDGRLEGGRRFKYRGLGLPAAYIVGSALLPDRRRVKLYSVHTLKRRKPDWFREDLTKLFKLQLEGKIDPLISEVIPLQDVQYAHQLLGEGSVQGKIILDCWA